MSKMKTASFAGDRPQGAGMRLPAGVCHVSEVMPLVLARYGLSLVETPKAERPAVASAASDFFDVSVAAPESALAS